MVIEIFSREVQLSKYRTIDAKPHIQHDTNLPAVDIEVCTSLECVYVEGQDISIHSLAREVVVSALKYRILPADVRLMI